MMFNLLVFYVFVFVFLSYLLILKSFGYVGFWGFNGPLFVSFFSCLVFFLLFFFKNLVVLWVVLCYSVVIDKILFVIPSFSCFLENVIWFSSECVKEDFVWRPYLYFVLISLPLKAFCFVSFNFLLSVVCFLCSFFTLFGLTLFFSKKFKTWVLSGCSDFMLWLYSDVPSGGVFSFKSFLYYSLINSPHFDFFSVVLVGVLSSIWVLGFFYFGFSLPLTEDMYINLSFVFSLIGLILVMSWVVLSSQLINWKFPYCGDSSYAGLSSKESDFGFYILFHKSVSSFLFYFFFLITFTLYLCFFKMGYFVKAYFGLMWNYVDKIYFFFDFLEVLINFLMVFSGVFGLVHFIFYFFLVIYPLLLEIVSYFNNDELNDFEELYSVELMIFNFSEYVSLFFIPLSSLFVWFVVFNFVVFGLDYFYCWSVANVDPDMIWVSSIPIVVVWKAEAFLKCLTCANLKFWWNIFTSFGFSVLLLCSVVVFILGKYLSDSWFTAFNSKSWYSKKGTLVGMKDLVNKNYKLHNSSFMSAYKDVLGLMLFVYYVSLFLKLIMFLVFMFPLLVFTFFCFSVFISLYFLLLAVLILVVLLFMFFLCLLSSFFYFLFKIFFMGFGYIFLVCSVKSVVLLFLNKSIKSSVSLVYSLFLIGKCFTKSKFPLSDFYDPLKVKTQKGGWFSSC